MHQSPVSLLHDSDHGMFWEGVVGIAACHEADEFALNFAKFVTVEQSLRLPVLKR